MGIIYKSKVFLVYLIGSLILSIYIGHQNNSQNIGIGIFVLCWLFLIGCQYLIRNNKSTDSRYVPQRIKDQILMIQKNRCNYCGEELGHVIDFHHLKEFKNGGQSTMDNIIAVHPECHAKLTRGRSI